MRFPYSLIALVFGFASTVLAQHHGPPRYAQCPAVQDAHQSNDDKYGQITPCELKTTRDSCSQRSPSSQASIKQSTTTTANIEDRAQQRRPPVAAGSCSQGNSMYATRGSTRKPQSKRARGPVLRRPLPPRSIIYYRRRRFAMFLLEFRKQDQWEALLARKSYLDRMARKQGYGYELKFGNYRLRVNSWMRRVVVYIP